VGPFALILVVAGQSRFFGRALLLVSPARFHCGGGLSGVRMVSGMGERVGGTAVQPCPTVEAWVRVGWLPVEVEFVVFGTC